MEYLNLFLAVLPGLIIIIYIYNKDKYDKEPKKYILLATLLGVISCFPAVLFTLQFEQVLTVKIPEQMNLLQLVYFSFVAVAFSEEIAKYTLLKVFLFPKKVFDEPMDGIVYAVCVGMGFAILENILYVLEGVLQLALLRMFTAVPAHAVFGVFMGYYLGLAKIRKKQEQPFAQYYFMAVISAVVLHGAYDFFLFSNNILGLSILSFLGLMMAVSMSKKLIKEHLMNSPFKNDAP